MRAPEFARFSDTNPETAASGRTAALSTSFMNAADPQADDTPFRTFMCVVCGFIYNEAEGWPDDGIEPGTRWEDVPETWTCPDCGVTKSDFEYDPGRDSSPCLEALERADGFGERLRPARSAPNLPSYRTSGRRRPAAPAALRQITPPESVSCARRARWPQPAR